MKRVRKLLPGIALICLMLGVVLFVVWYPSVIARKPFSAPEAVYQNLDEILSHPQPITIRTYSTGIMQTTLGGIMNLDHEKAQNIADKVIEIPVNVGLVHHKDFGAYLIDAGLDASYVDNPHGTIKGMMVEPYLGKGSQEPGALKICRIRQPGVNG